MSHLSPVKSMASCNYHKSIMLAKDLCGTVCFGDMMMLIVTADPLRP